MATTNGRLSGSSEQASALFRALFDQSPEPALVVDDGRHHVEVNQAACRLLGRSRKDLLRRRLDDVLAPAVRPEIEVLWRDFLAGAAMTGDIELVRPDGSMRWVKFSSKANLAPGFHLLMPRDVTEEERAEQALRESEERFRTAIETMPDPFAIHTAIRDETGRIVDFSFDYVNEATATFNGLSAQLQMGGRLLELFPAVRDGGLFDAFVRVVETGEPFASESVVYEDPNGAGGPIRSVLDIRAVKLGDGYVVASRDLTARARAEQALQASEERYRTLVEQSSDAIFVLDADGRVFAANTASERLLGYAPGELRGRSWDELITPDDLAAHPLHFADLREGKTLRFERQLWRADGLVVPVELSAGMLSDGRLLHTARDISERFRTERALRESARNLQEAERIAHVGSWTLDPTTGDATWSPEMYRILGLDPDGPAVGLADISTLFSPDSVRRVTAAIERGVQTGESWRMDLETVRPDGRRGWVISSGIVERDATGNVTMIRGTMQDVTQQRRLEAQLRQSQRLEAVGQLAGGIAHDFNNLLTAIRGYAELLRRSLPTDDERSRADIEQVVLAADRAAALTRQLLAFSRRQVLQPEVLEPAAIVEGIAPMLRRLLGEHVALTTHAAPGLGPVKVDPGQLEQVIVNLAVNARDAMPDGGNLTIELSNVELGQDYAAGHAEAIPVPYVLLAVSDTGVGMDAETQAHIFEPFFTTKEPGKGTGMGLATVYGIIEQSGGSINVYSEPARGTTFKIYLPRVIDEPTAAAAVTLAARPSSSGSETILLVEDDPAVRGFARRALEGSGYTVLEAASGADALSIAASHAAPIALLVTDVIMPGLQGHQLAEQLTASRPELRVLYVSGFTENSVIHHGVPEHGVAFLSKPYGAEALCGAVRRGLDGQGDERADPTGRGGQRSLPRISGQGGAAFGTAPTTGAASG